MEEFDVRKYYKKIDVLDKGHVELIDGPQEDPKTKIVNAARVSFKKQTNEVRPQDIKLIEFMKTHGHWSVFRHSHFSFRIKAPLSIFRQWWKYQIDSHWEDNEDPLDACGSIIMPNTNWNEASFRYVEIEPEFYIPSEIRKQSKDNKQGSLGKVEILPNGYDPVEYYKEGLSKAYEYYKYMVAAGCAKEQCRFLIPPAVYTECIWTASLQTLMFFLSQRLKSDAQYEIRQYALAVLDLIAPIYAPIKLFDDRKVEMITDEQIRDLISLLPLIDCAHENPNLNTTKQKNNAMRLLSKWAYSRGIQI